MLKYLAAAVLCGPAMFAADPTLLSLVMPDAKVIAGVQVDQAKISPFGQYVLSHMQPDDPGFKKFESDTGFDPSRDLSEIVMASNATTDVTSHWLVVARGRFDASKIAAAAQQNGATATSFEGVSILAGATAAKAAEESVIAFGDNSTAFMGDPDSVKATITRFHSTQTASPFAAQVKPLVALYDFWFLTLVPLSEFSAVMPDPNMGQALHGNLFQSISQASGGIKFGANVQIAMQAVTRSEKDAQALVDVVRFIGGLIQTNKDRSAAAGQVSNLVDQMNLSTSGNVLNMSLSIPESQVEQILMAPRSKKQSTARNQH